MDQGTPHRVVDSILDSAADGAKSLVFGISGALTGLGEGVQSGLDQPFKAMGAPDQPLRIVDRFLDGTINATVHAVNQGCIESLKMEGESVQRGLDHPVENFGVPPSLGTGMPSLGGGLGRFKPPRFPRLGR